MDRDGLRHLFDVARAEEKERDLEQRAWRRQLLELEEREQRLEYMIESLNPTALIAIHITDHFPNRGVIHPTVHFPLGLFEHPSASKVIEDYRLRYPRVTIHFSLNCAVRGVAAHGQMVKWTGKYAILIPVKDIIERIVCLNPVDTWIIGSLRLPKSAEILMPEHEYARDPEMWREHAGDAQLVPYQADLDPADAADRRVRVKGYSLTNGGDHGWFEHDSDLAYIDSFLRRSRVLTEAEQLRLRKLAVEKGCRHWTQVFHAIAEKYQKRMTKHSATEWRQLESFFEQATGLIFNSYYSDLLESPAREVASTLEMHARQAQDWRDRIRSIRAEERRASQEEARSLSVLEEGLENLRVFLVSLHAKAMSAPAGTTWERFLRTEGIL